MTEDPSLADQCQRILRIPQKRQIRKSLGYLSADEIKKILDEIDRLSKLGRRDYLLIALIYDTGARVQEVLDLKPCDFRFDSPAHVRILAHFSAFLKIKKNRNFNIFSHSKMLSKSSRNLAKY